MQSGDVIDRYFKLGKNLNQSDTIAFRKMVGGLVKLIYPDGEFTKEELEEIIRFALEMRRRVKEQLKKLGGMEFYDVNFSYIDNDTFEEHYVSVPEQGGGKLIPEGICNPGQVYNVSRGKQECSVYSDLNLGYCQVTVSLRKQVLEVTVKQRSGRYCIQLPQSQWQAYQRLNRHIH